MSLKLTPLQTQTLRELLHRRDAALADIRSGARGEGLEDRVADVAWVNRTIEDMARRLAVSPAELIEAARQRTARLRHDITDPTGDTDLRVPAGTVVEIVEDDPTMALVKARTGETFPVERDEIEAVTCCFCGATVADVDSAIGAGWEPGYFRDPFKKDWDGRPVCPKCQAEYLHLARPDDGESTLRPGFEPAP